MKIGSGISRVGFGSKKAFKPQPSTKYDAEDEDTTDREVIPPKRKPPKPGVLPKSVSSKSLATVERLSRVATKVTKSVDTHPRKTRRFIVDDSPVEDVVEDFDLDDRAEDLDDHPAYAVLPKRSEALAISSTLGIQDFEVDSVRPAAQEDLVPELDDSGEPDWKAARKNDRTVAIPARLPGDASSDRVRGIVTMFGQRADTILGLLEHEDRTDGALSLIQRTLLQTMVDVLPVIERGVRRSNGKRGVVPLNQTVSQIRELVTDLQSLRDRGHLGATIVERVLRPAFLDIGVQIALAFNAMVLSAKLKMPEEDFKVFAQELQETQRGIATYMQQQYSEVKEGVSSSLS